MAEIGPPRVRPLRELLRVGGAAFPALVLIALSASAALDAFVRASFATLGRDQGIFQYIAWAVGEGDVLYRDVRDVNGPLITMVHALIQRLVSDSEHGFRLVDLTITSISFLMAGALVPAIVTPRVQTPPKPTEMLIRSSAWALAAWGVLGAQYIAYGYWDTAQRESFLDWFLLVSVTIQAVASERAVPLAAAGALSLLTCFGKPTYALFTLVQLAAIVVDEAPWRTRRTRALTFLLGGVLGASVPIAFVLLRGDAAAWLRMMRVDVPTMYRFIWPRPPLTILRLPGYAMTSALAALASTALSALIVMRWLPRHALPIAMMPLAGLACMLGQAKGFPYHFHPVTLGTWFGGVLIVAAFWQRSLDPKGEPRHVLAWRASALAMAAALGGCALGYARATPYPAAPPMNARTDAALTHVSHLEQFNRVDYFPNSLREAAEYVRQHTRPDERVQLYAMDPYLLFLAKRKSASPFILAYDLNMDAALHGSFEAGGLVPTEAERERIRAMQRGHEGTMRAKLEREPPGAFVFVDQSPLMSDDDALIDFRAHCPATDAWMRARYVVSARFGVVAVWLRRERASSVP